MIDARGSVGGLRFSVRCRMLASEVSEMARPRATSDASRPDLVLRLYLGREALIGRGKIELLERIEATGSILAAGRAMGMSYKRAWTLVDSLNGAFETALVEKQHGGRSGGGAALTALGRDLVRRYRSLERKAAKAAAAEIRAIARNLRQKTP